MGVFRVTIYGIMAAVFLYALGYDILYMPRIGHTWWIYKLVMLTMSNLVSFHFIKKDLPAVFLSLKSIFIFYQKIFLENKRYNYDCNNFPSFIKSIKL